MYRACSTWQYEVAAALIESHRNATRLGYLTSREYAEFVRSDSAGGLNRASHAWRVLKSHEGAPCFSRALALGRARALYSRRDVRDVVFSMMHKRGLSFRQLLRQGTIHQILANDRYWTRQPGVLIQRYEDLISDPVAGVKEVAIHLGIELAPGDAERIADEYSQESNRARTRALQSRLQAAGVDLSSPSNAQICDAETLLHWNHMRSAPSSWRDQATPQQSRILESVCGRWLLAHGYSKGTGATDITHGRQSVDEPFARSADRVVGRANFLARAVSLRFPGTIDFLKQHLAPSAVAAAAARTWPEEPPARAPARERSAVRPAVSHQADPVTTRDRRT
jgi:hypothetical protein